MSFNIPAKRNAENAFGKFVTCVPLIYFVMFVHQFKLI